MPFSAPEDVILRTNAALALSVLGGRSQAGIPKIVAASSPTVLGYGAPKGWLPDRLPLDEDSPTLPWNAYALSKQLIEQTIAMLQRQTGDAMRFAAFRPCYVIAPEEWAGAPTQQGHTVRERLDDPALSAPALFNYVDARDVATFAIRCSAALDDIPNGEVFFVGADDALAREPLAELLPRFHPGTASRRRGAHRHAPGLLEREGATAARLAPPNTTGATELDRAPTDPKGRAGMNFDGILFFPVTPFDASDRVDADLLAQHIATHPRARTRRRLPRVRHRRVPRPLGDRGGARSCGSRSRPSPVRCRSSPERAGRSVTPPRSPARPPTPVRTRCSCCRPTWWAGTQAGLVAYVEAIAAASALPVVIYHRGTAQYSVDVGACGSPRIRRSSASRTASATSAPRSSSCARSPRPAATTSRSSTAC